MNEVKVFEYRGGIVGEYICSLKGFKRSGLLELIRKKKLTGVYFEEVVSDEV